MRDTIAGCRRRGGEEISRSTPSIGSAPSLALERLDMDVAGTIAHCLVKITFTSRMTTASPAIFSRSAISISWTTSPHRGRGCPGSAAHVSAPGHA